MYCPECGFENPNDVFSCQQCGAPLDPMPVRHNSDPYFTPAPSAQNPYGASPYEANPYAPAKANNSLAPILITITLLLLAGAAVWYFFFYNSSTTINGTYQVKEIQAKGVTIAADTAKQYGFDTDQISLIVHGSTCTVNAPGVSGEYDLKRDGNSLTLTGPVDSGTGTYDKKTQTITLTQNGVSIVFVKNKLR